MYLQRYLRCFQADDAGQMKAETCTFEVVLVIMYYKHISEKMTYIRRASHEGGRDKLYTPLYFLYPSDYMQLTQSVIFVPL